MSSTAHLLDSLRVGMNKNVSHTKLILWLISWIKSYGEINLLFVGDLLFFVRERRHGFYEERFQQIDEISRADSDNWFCLSPFQLRLMYTFWR